MRENRQIKAVIFDLFSTLTSLKHTPCAPGQDSHVLLGLDRKEWLKAIFDDSRDRLIGKITDPVEILKDVAWKVDPTIEVALLEEVAAMRKVRFRYCLESPPEGVIESLKKIKAASYPLALISNADVTEVEAWHDTELGSLFDISLFSCHEGYMKPEPEIFQLCLDKLGLTGPECLYVGDGGNDELIASQKAGMTTALTSQFLKTTWPEKVEERAKTVKHHITNLDEILPLLEKLG